ncbi:hypothetical protein K438DRAFT_1801922 [Mycena galopus ATCC 62051]|nr:hypothetical protein K438DRAFT_1801922 [Mycena galopus ATCC 62051]
MAHNSTETAGLLQLVEDSRLTGYFAGMQSSLTPYLIKLWTVASLCVLIYDHILCFAQEVDLMWQSRWGLTKTIYLWNRYFSLISISLVASVMVREITTNTGCTNWLKMQCITSTVVVGTVDFVLMLRVWILYGRPRVFLWLFTCMGIVELIIMSTVGFVAFAEMSLTGYIHLG